MLWHIGDVVRKLRQARGWSQQQLATAAGIKSANTISGLERDVSNFEQNTIGKIAVALNVTIDGLYAELPGVHVPPGLDATDAETIARFAQLSPAQKAAIRTLVDQLGRYPDRPLASPTPDDAHATQPADPIPRRHP